MKSGKKKKRKDESFRFGSKPDEITELPLDLRLQATTQSLDADKGQTQEGDGGAGVWNSRRRSRSRRSERNGSRGARSAQTPEARRRIIRDTGDSSDECQTITLKQALRASVGIQRQGIEIEGERCSAGRRKGPQGRDCQRARCSDRTEHKVREGGGLRGTESGISATGATFIDTDRITERDAGRGARSAVERGSTCEIDVTGNRDGFRRRNQPRNCECEAEISEHFHGGFWGCVVLSIAYATAFRRGADCFKSTV